MQMQRRNVILKILICAIVLCGQLFACAGAGNNAMNENFEGATNKFRIIVRFNQSELNPEEPELIQYLSDSVGGELEFVQMLSGGAVIYAGKSSKSEAELLDALEKLKSGVIINSVELDQRRRTQSVP